ncbi:MAG: hypothetical protein LBF89_04610 [Bacteroidales bacterium]|nr:hypothetical protein [Bacteroidales bacterium]
MKKKAGNKIIRVWLLIAVLMLPFVVKSVHVHRMNAVCIGCDGHEHHDSDNCPVCQFALFSFTEAEQTELAVVTACGAIRTAVCGDKPFLRFICPCLVRGPPAV